MVTYPRSCGARYRRPDLASGTDLPVARTGRLPDPFVLQAVTSLYLAVGP